MAEEKPAKSRIPKLAYLDEKFMQGADARTLRIGAEYLRPMAQLKRASVKNTVVFFGSARVLPHGRALERLHQMESEGAPAAQLRRARMAVEMSRYYEEARELARLITRWSLSLRSGSHFLVVCSGGGPGIMEAANRGASEAGGLSIGFNIKLPVEQEPNPYITPQLNFLFKYFFMRKLWFAQPCKAIVVFPGGFGTMDELWEFLTLIQTHKMGHRAAILLYGSDFWKKAINFSWLAEAGTVTTEELQLVRFVDSPREAFEVLKQKLSQLLHLRTQPTRPFV